MNALAPPASAALHATSIDDDSSKRRALFLVDAQYSLEQQAIMIAALERTGRWAPYLLPLDGSNLANYDGVERLRIWSLSDPASAPNGGAPQSIAEDGARVETDGGKLRRGLSWLLRQPVMAIPREFVLAAAMAAHWRRARAAARKSLQSLAPACVVVAQPKTEVVLPIVAAAQDLGIPVILATSGGVFMPDGGAYMRRNDPSCALDRGVPGTPANGGQRLLNRMVGWMSPDQVMHSRWGRMLYRPAYWYIAAYVADLCPERAWFNGTRFIDAVVVSGDDERRVCERAGIPAFRVAAIGAPALQLQYERRRDRERVRAELGIGQGQNLLIVALTQLWEHRMLDETAHFAYVDRLLALLSKRDETVIISLHPKMKPEHYLPRIRAAGLRVADRSLIEILAAADLFIAGAYSSTVRWAMAIGIPCINLDLWELNESTYTDIPEYPTVRSWDAVEQWLDARLVEGHARGDISVPPMGLICDGQFREKFVALADRLTEGHA